jgi:hypothetical protein
MSMQRLAIACWSGSICSMVQALKCQWAARSCSRKRRVFGYVYCAFEQQLGCPDYVVAALGAERVQSLCGGECYRAGGDRRKAIYPDTPTVRTDMARHYNNIAYMDAEVGVILQQLETAGLADSMIVI